MTRHHLRLLLIGRLEAEIGALQAALAEIQAELSALKATRTRR